MRSCFGIQTRTLRTGPVLVSETDHRPGLRTPAHSHDFACVHLVLEGCYQESTRRGETRAEPGSVVFKPAGQEHWNAFSAAGARSLRMQVEPGALGRLDRFLPGRLVVLQDPRLGLIAGRLRCELRGEDELTDVAAESLVMELLVATARIGGAPPPDDGDPHLARRCKDLLNETYRGPVALSGAARELGVHRTVLARAFREAYGLSVGAYVRRLRVRWVAVALEREPGRSLADVALEAGFADQSHLTRTFKDLMGATPGSYRRRLGGPDATLVQRATAVQDSR